MIKKISQKIHSNIIRIYSKIVPFFIIKLLPNRTAPAKQRFNFILDLAKKNKIKIFVETGTYLGDTTNSLANYFNKIYTFEISEELVKLAKQRFKKKNHIEVIHGDSGLKLSEVLLKINEKTIFWLDGHYSDGFLYAQKNNLDTPIIKEIETIFQSNIKDLDNIILIDDAFEFDGTRGYPTFEELNCFIKKFTDRYSVFIKYNIIFIVPSR
jgi:hypothetical protein